MHQQFSTWKKWKDRKTLQGIKYPGVYILCYTEKDISETAFSWREEIIYIGMTNSHAGLRGRLQQFERTIAGKYGHGGAERVRYKYPDYQTFTNNLYVSVQFVECDVKSDHPHDLVTMGEISKLEYVCLAEYVKLFGKRPEFNDQSSPKRR